MSGGERSPRASDLLVRSGLALAGANRRSLDASGLDDGILTALEARDLDLTGTRLVTLPSCGPRPDGKPSAGAAQNLRRSLLEAGAETVVVSLWETDESATTELLADYYADLQQGRGRSQALRHAQLSMRAREGRTHPHYWANLVAVGDHRSFDGKDLPVEPAAKLALDARASRGCACTLPLPTPSNTPAGPLALFAAALAMIARRRPRA